MKLERMLRGYEKQGDKLVFEVILERVPLSELRTLYSLDDDHPMYDCYPVGDDAERLIRKYNGIPELDYVNIEYFLECQAE